MDAQNSGEPKPWQTSESTGGKAGNGIVGRVLGAGGIKSAEGTNRIILGAFVIVSLLTIMYLAGYTRSSTLSAPTVLDYDPWWWFRQAKRVVDNNFVLPKWDELSFYPPGRPTDFQNGWPYILAAMYKVFNPLLGWDLTAVAKWSTIIFAALTAIPAYFLGKKMSNEIGGIIVALFIVLSPGLISVSMAGYSDTDMIVSFFTMLSTLSLLIVIKQKEPLKMKALPVYALAIIVNLYFVFTWGYGWIIQLFFLGLVPGLFVFRAIEQIVHKRVFKIDFAEILKESRSILIPLLIVIIPVNLIGAVMGWGNIVTTVLTGLNFFEGNALIVDISVAELQTVNIFTVQGLATIAERIGLEVSTLLAFAGLFGFIVIYKLVKSEKIDPVEIYLFLWIAVTFILITRGVRFSLLFGAAAAATIGYVVGNVPKLLNNSVLKATFFGFVLMVSLLLVSNAITTGNQGSGMLISQNWYNMLDWFKANANPKALLVTWWDPGHILTGYTGLRTMADGAHCPPGPGGCNPYSHDDRIQDMGRAFSVSDENESLSILKKYQQLTPAQCTQDKAFYGDIFPADGCDKVPEMYVIASNDLIGKYYWLSYFGTGTGRNFLQLGITNYDSNQGIISYGSGAISLVYQNGQWLPVINYPDQGIRNVVVRDIIYYQNNQMVKVTSNQSQTIDGMVFVDPSFQAVIFMDGPVRDSVFTQMYFFNGQGLKNFQLVYSNPEIRVFKVLFPN
jgi:asparagine N-glycosylation enzyme membrane subunit Stt3